MLWYKSLDTFVFFGLAYNLAVVRTVFKEAPDEKLLLQRNLDILWNIYNINDS